MLIVYSYSPDCQAQTFSIGLSFECWTSQQFSQPKLRSLHAPACHSFWSSGFLPTHSDRSPLHAAPPPAESKQLSNILNQSLPVFSWKHTWTCLLSLWVTLPSSLTTLKSQNCSFHCSSFCGCFHTSGCLCALVCLYSQLSLLILLHIHLSCK